MVLCFKSVDVPSCTHLMFVKVHEELIAAIRDAEEGLLHLKRARLLREADSVLQVSKSTIEDVKVEPLDPRDDVEAEAAEPLEEQGFVVGSKCRFRHTDGRWYNGQIIGLESSTSAKISFLTPTSESMLVSVLLTCFPAFCYMMILNSSNYMCVNLFLFCAEGCYPYTVL